MGVSYQPNISTVPVGTIVMWKGTVATIPTGWTLCNGSNGTPDLRNRFIVGANADSGGEAKTNILGYYTKTGGNVNSIGYIDSPYLSAGDAIADSYPTTGWTADLSGNIVYNQGAEDSTNILPMYYALAFIMKQ